MKKTIYLIGIAASIMGGITSCTLDAEDYVTKSSENFPATTEDATQALAGIYQNLNQVSATPECSFLYAAMLASDDCLGGGGPNDLHMQSLDMLLNSKQDMTQQFWKDRYQGINRANSLLDGIENIQLAESDKNQIEGEAKFLRAFYYYELVFLSLSPHNPLSQANRPPLSYGDKSYKTCVMQRKLCPPLARRTDMSINTPPKPCWAVLGYSIQACIAMARIWLRLPAPLTHR